MGVSIDRRSVGAPICCRFGVEIEDLRQRGDRRSASAILGIGDMRQRGDRRTGNVLLLRNSLHLSLDEPEVSLQKLLSLLAEKLIDSNSNVQDKDDAYVINQQQNIADASDMLLRLATGIDVNVQFRKSIFLLKCHL